MRADRTHLVCLLLLLLLLVVVLMLVLVLRRRRYHRPTGGCPKGGHNLLQMHQGACPARLHTAPTAVAPPT
jgi:hypothetical protein